MELDEARISSYTMPPPLDFSGTSLAGVPSSSFAAPVVNKVFANFEDATSFFAGFESRLISVDYKIDTAPSSARSAMSVASTALYADDSQEATSVDSKSSSSAIASFPSYLFLVDTFPQNLLLDDIDRVSMTPCVQ